MNSNGDGSTSCKVVKNMESMVGRAKVGARAIRVMHETLASLFHLKLASIGSYDLSVYLFIVFSSFEGY